MYDQAADRSDPTALDPAQLLLAAHASIQHKVSVISPPPNVENELLAIYNVALRMQNPDAQVVPHGEFVPSTGGVNSTAQALARHPNAAMIPGGGSAIPPIAPSAAPVNTGPAHEYAPGQEPAPDGRVMTDAATTEDRIGITGTAKHGDNNR
jgi:hypothetical protein